MLATYNELAKRAIELLRKSEHYRVIIVIIGAPGSGKSTVAKEVAAIINKTMSGAQVIATPGDGAVKESVTKFIDSISDVKFSEDIESDNYQPYKRKIDDTTVEIYGKGGPDTRITVKFNRSGQVEPAKRFATVIPMDGFHLTRQQLAEHRDAETAIFRRGSPFTFDNVNIINMTKILKLTTEYRLPEQDIEVITEGPLDIEIPSFSHELKDPVPNEISIPSSARILILEGNYLLLKDKNWSAITEVLAHVAPASETPLFINDTKGAINEVPITSKSGVEFWKICVESNENAHRVAKRHLLSGIVDSIEEGERRFNLNDSVNGEYLLKNSVPCDLNVYSIEEEEE